MLGLLLLALPLALGLFGLYVLYKFRVKARGRARKLITGGAVVGILIPAILSMMIFRDATVAAYLNIALTTIGYVCILLGLLQFLREIDVVETE